MATYLMNISQIRDQLQGLREIVSDSEMTTCVLNTLPFDWSSFTTSIYSKEDTTPFDAQCILEESRIRLRMTPNQMKTRKPLLQDTR